MPQLFAVWRARGACKSFLCNMAGLACVVHLGLRGSPFLRFKRSYGEGVENAKIYVDHPLTVPTPDHRCSRDAEPQQSRFVHLLTERELTTGDRDRFLVRDLG